MTYRDVCYGEPQQGCPGCVPAATGYVCTAGPGTRRVPIPRKPVEEAL